MNQSAVTAVTAPWLWLPQAWVFSSSSVQVGYIKSLFSSIFSVCSTVLCKHHTQQWDRVENWFVLFCFSFPGKLLLFPGDNNCLNSLFAWSPLCLTAIQPANLKSFFKKCVCRVLDLFRRVTHAGSALGPASAFGTEQSSWKVPRPPS